MAMLENSDKTAFFAEVATAAHKANYAAVATILKNEPRIRMVQPVWVDDYLWIATSGASPMAKQLKDTPIIDVHWQVYDPDLLHIRTRGRAEFPDDPAVKEKVWHNLAYDPTEFWKSVEDPDFAVIKISPTRVEMTEQYGTGKKQVWKSS